MASMVMLYTGSSCLVDALAQVAHPQSVWVNLQTPVLSLL
jgi:hypothetical protein